MILGDAAGRNEPPHQFALAGGVTEWIGLDMNTLPDGGQKPTKPKRNRHWTIRLNDGYLVDENGCHVWQRAINKAGYGVIGIDGRVQLPHRAAFFVKHGRWPAPGLVLDHLCENRACMNVDHLDEVTNAENIRRSFTPLDPKGNPRQRRKRPAVIRDDPSKWTHGGSGNAYNAYGCRCEECVAANTRRVKRRAKERLSEPVRGAHGNASTYSNWGCRCAECTAAHAERIRRRHLERLAEGVPETVLHGKAATYSNWGCRCEPCSAAQREKGARQYAKRMERAA